MDYIRQHSLSLEQGDVASKNDLPKENVTDTTRLEESARIICQKDVEIRRKSNKTLNQPEKIILDKKISLHYKIAVGSEDFNREDPNNMSVSTSGERSLQDSERAFFQGITAPRYTPGPTSRPISRGAASNLNEYSISNSSIDLQLPCESTRVQEISAISESRDNSSYFAPVKPIEASSVSDFSCVEELE